MKTPNFKYFSSVLYVVYFVARCGFCRNKYYCSRYYPLCGRHGRTMFYYLYYKVVGQKIINPIGGLEQIYKRRRKNKVIFNVRLSIPYNYQRLLVKAELVNKANDALLSEM